MRMTDSADQQPLVSFFLWQPKFCFSLRDKSSRAKSVYGFDVMRCSKILMF